MNRFERSFAILLLLRDGHTAWSAAELARRLAVSKRTIYRDIETLGAAGIPVYAEAGRSGGFRLVEGYFLPPIALSVGEATSLLTGLALLDRLRVKPFAADLETAKRKLLAVVPTHLRQMLAQTENMIGFEPIPDDIFHPEREAPETAVQHGQNEAQIITTFLQSIYDQQAIRFEYASPYTPVHTTYTLLPQGIVWDRDHWYLVGKRLDRDDKPRLWRADRVVSLTPIAQALPDQPAYNIEDLLGRKWLTSAIASWAENAPMKIQMTPAQAERLKRDWYYGHAHYETLPSGNILMRYGEANQAFVFELLRWLGTGAELVAPEAWRETFADTLRAMLTAYKPP